MWYAADLCGCKGKIFGHKTSRNPPSCTARRRIEIGMCLSPENRKVKTPCAARKRDLQGRCGKDDLGEFRLLEPPIDYPYPIRNPFVAETLVKKDLETSIPRIETLQEWKPSKIETSKLRNFGFQFRLVILHSRWIPFFTSSFTP